MRSSWTTSNDTQSCIRYTEARLIRSATTGRRHDNRAILSPSRTSKVPRLKCRQNPSSVSTSQHVPGLQLLSSNRILSMQQKSRSELHDRTFVPSQSILIPISPPHSSTLPRRFKYPLPLQIHLTLEPPIIQIKLLPLVITHLHHTDWLSPQLYLLYNFEVAAAAWGQVVRPLR